MAELLKKDQMRPGTVVEGGSMAKLYTGSWRTYCPVTDFEKCTHCMICWIMCPDSAIQVEDGKKLGTDMQYCKGCGICAAVCPVDAIEIKLESDMSEDERKG
ncbi:MAG: 4Fe-4S binding protein [Planctomycetota bacterium]|jgi:pyruvate ferredoxin oxidoreductase delta subunit